MNDKYIRAQAAFLSWLKKFSPPLYARVITDSQLAGLFENFGAIDWGGIIDKTVNLGKEYLQFDQQKELLKIQADRAKAGLLPLQTPTAQTIVVQQQPTAAQLQTQELTSMLVKTLPWLLGGLILLKFLPK